MAIFTKKNMFHAATLLLRGYSLTKIKDEMNLPYVETVRRLIKAASVNGILRLVPPLEHRLRDEVAKTYKFAAERIRVVDIDTPLPTKGNRPRTLNGYRDLGHPGEYVAASAARLVFRLIKEVGADRWPKGEKVTIGLGPGRASRDFCKHLAMLLRAMFEDCVDLNVDDKDGVHDHDVKPSGAGHSQSRYGGLKFVAISAGCPAREPQYNSCAFFNYFADIPDAEFVGLNGSALVEQKEYTDKRIQNTYGVREAFAEKDNIDIVVSSMGDIDDTEDQLRNFMIESGADIKELKRKGYLGSFQYRPYSKTGPILEKPNDLRAVTIFELQDFRKMVESKKKVILIARACAVCHRNRAEVLKPLLTEPELNVCNYVVMDVPTAHGLLAL
jgi:hypothetical protein